MKHDDAEWYKSAGIGFGEYLDPDAALRVDAYYQSGKKHADLYSQTQLLQAIWKRPRDALAFKVVRLPVLWLGTVPWPDAALTRVSMWCIAMYVILAVFCVVQRVRRRAIPEVLYLYLLLILFASAVIHFEFRYTFPIWNTLIMVPGLLFATLTRQGWLAHTPTGFRPLAQGWSPSATYPGRRGKCTISTPTGLRPPRRHADATPLG